MNYIRKRRAEELQDAIDVKQAAAADVIVCATGNLAHIYFEFVPPATRWAAKAVGRRLTN